ncbi:dihydropyrimidinase [Agrococcus sp. HG114]|uniref:dihydropyrimidinase n=1 Tax=Agrococcus sp. HG114 TaxID=2969757 RepID=UPI00215AC960|nr:dihydropyrimidinase [Agrococcus sp. HG114]MCR8669792.1 dihydropyrimidinase [Agrococcus sp. HG114]
MTRTLLRGGTLVSSVEETRADLLIDGERIVAVGLELDAGDATVVDVTGCALLPGGIDTHTHFEHMVASGATRTADDFTSGSIAALCGGTTTVVDFVRAPADTGIRDAFLRRRDRAAESIATDFGLHPMATAAVSDAASIAELQRLATEEGATSWKFFMAYPGSMVGDDVLLAGFRAAAEVGALPMVHAENGHMVADAIARLVADGRVDPTQHVHGHPGAAEAEAIQRAAALAKHAGSELFVVHVSAAEAVDALVRLRDEGQRIGAETCPQYVGAAADAAHVTGALAAGFVCSPPIREAANQEAIWRGIEQRVLHTIGTDHAAFTLAQPEDLPPQKVVHDDFTRVPNGVPGVEERLMVMHELGVRRGRFPLTRFVDLVAAEPARRFGLERKGSLAPGKDADVVVWDPAATRTLRASELHSRSDYCVYEGLEVHGTPRSVWRRGTLVAEHGEPVGELAGTGAYQYRSTTTPTEAR